MSKLDRLLNLAASQVGYTEKDNDKDLDAMVGSTAGSGNHTKYARDVTASGLTGYCGSAWCAVYQFWLDMQTIGKDQALEHFGPQYYNCFAVRDYAKARSRWLPATAEPKPGYRVIFRQSHIALVTKVTANKIYTNEGNTNNGTAVVRNGGMVCNKSYERSNSSILGYVVVDYPEEYQEGWQHDGTGWWYCHADGSYTSNAWEPIGGKWYWFNGAGYMIESKWYQDNGRWYYLGADGAMATGLQVIDGKVYYFDGSGAMAEEPVTLIPDDKGALH